MLRGFCIENRIREMADLIQVVVLDCDGNKLRRPDGTWETMEIGQSTEVYKYFGVLWRTIVVISLLLEPTVRRSYLLSSRFNVLSPNRKFLTTVKLPTAAAKIEFGIFAIVLNA